MPDQYYDLTIGEILRHHRAYQKRQSLQWEQSRFIAWYGSLPHLKKGSQMRPEDILSLPTDPSEEEKAIMIEQQKIAEQEAMAAVFETYRQMGYSV